MRFVMFYHSLISDWNHGNAHFLRGVVTELLGRGHEVAVYEPRDGWSLHNLRRDQGTNPVEQFVAAYPQLRTNFYEPRTIRLDQVLEDADVVIVHEWNDHDLVYRIGQHRARSGGYHLLFHDTHHRSVTDPQSMAAYDLRFYDGVLAFGRVIRDLYLKRGWTRQAWIWHEAADTRVFRQLPRTQEPGDLVWIGNWGDDERTAELREFLFEPVQRLGLQAVVHGVRYPEEGLRAIQERGIEYRGWLANFHVPRVFAQFRATLHVPRRPYREQLPGIPTIRVFEALACGIPLICAPWDDAEHLFTPGKDYLVARTGEDMVQHLRHLLHDQQLAHDLAEHGKSTILSRHTCVHRAEELLKICQGLHESKNSPEYFMASFI